jgi:hypothetical protein
METETVKVNIKSLVKNLHIHAGGLEKSVHFKNDVLDAMTRVIRNASQSTLFDELDENEQAVLAAYSRLRKKAKEKRGDWTPDWSDDNQRKCYPWLKFEKGSGFGFSLTHYYYVRTGTTVGSRICFPTSEMAMEFAKENLEDYNIIFSK